MPPLPRSLYAPLDMKKWPSLVLQLSSSENIHVSLVDLQAHDAWEEIEPLALRIIHDGIVAGPFGSPRTEFRLQNFNFYGLTRFECLRC